jgi:uncharacterized protein (DUF1778 family)
MVLPRKKKQTMRKVERVEARLNPEQKRRIERAARLKGMSISDFIVLSADHAAAQAIHEHETWLLTGRDRQQFVRALQAPRARSARMMAAAKRYRRHLKSELLES